MYTEFACKVALITGGSRGVGAATAIALAEIGFDVALTYRNKAARAEEVVQSVVSRGRRALAIQCDITDPSDVAALIASLRDWTGRLDALVLSASGGMERERLAADPGFPMRINRDAQVAVLDAILPIVPRGGIVVFVTSHWAHLYGRVEQFPMYAPIAESKHAGEVALRSRLPDLAQRGVRLAVVTGDLVEGTITPRLMERASPGLMAQRRSQVADLPTTSDVGRAIASAITDDSLPSGHTVVVGGSLDSLLQ